MKRVWLGLAVLLALGLGLGRDGAAAPKGTLTIGIPTDINTLDPHMGPEVNSLNVAYSTMEALLRLDAQGNIKPQLAESWEVVDNTTYVFRLRKNVKFHNGEPFNGKAVEYSLEAEPGEAPGQQDQVGDRFPDRPPRRPHHPDRHREARPDLSEEDGQA